MSARKTKHHKWTLDELLDSARDHIGHILDNMSPRDIIYMIAYGSAVIVVYNLLAKARNIPLINIALGGALRLRDPRLRDQLTDTLSNQSIDLEVLAMSLVGGYMLLKIDVADVTSALTKVTSAIQTVGLV